MWKVVAADDEGYIREALKKLINWEKMDCDLIAVLETDKSLSNVSKKNHRILLLQIFRCLK